MTDEDDITLYHLTKNVIDKTKIFGFPKRNLMEAAISLVLLILVLFLIPFTTIVRVIAFLVFGTALFVINLRGIHNHSITQIMIAEYKFRKNRRILRLYGPEWKRKKGGYSYVSESSDNEKIRKIAETVKQRINQFIDENS